MKTISGSTITYNPLRGGLPFVEAILSALPICDEFVVVNDSTDGTTEVLERMARRYGKIKIINERFSIEQGCSCLATATNRALAESQGEWTVHVQADEVIHPTVLPVIRKIIEEDRVSSIFFNRGQFTHNFQTQHNFMVNLVRAGKTRELVSLGDAMSFGVRNAIPYERINYGGALDLFDITRNFVENFPGRAENCWELWGKTDYRMWGLGDQRWQAKIDRWKVEGFPEVYTRTVSPFYEILPPSMWYWLGRTKYFAREELL